MSDWQPIETAPRDGTMVLVWLGAWPVIASAKMPGGTVRGHPTGWAYPTGATHWMPLPPPPSNNPKGEG